MPPALLATDLRRGVAGLALLATRDLGALWALVGTAAEARAALMDVLPPLVDRYGAAAATLAADWYDTQRARAEVPGRFAAIIPAGIEDSGAEALAGWGVQPLFKAEPDWASAQTLVQGGLQRRIANASRSTVAGSAVADPHAHGWRRAGSGGCDFCRALIAKGAVYRTHGADFTSHDHCHCMAVPAFK